MNTIANITYNGEKIALPSTFYRVSVKALIYNEKNEFLMIKDEEGYYSLPGGGVEYGEEVKDTLKKEVHEETGFRVDFRDSYPLCIFDGISISDIPHIFITYACLMESGDFTPSDEAIEILWINKNMIHTLSLNPSLSKLLMYKELL